MRPHRLGALALFAALAVAANANAQPASSDTLTRAHETCAQVLRQAQTMGRSLTTAKLKPYMTQYHKCLRRALASNVGG